MHAQNAIVTLILSQNYSSLIFFSHRTSRTEQARSDALRVFVCTWPFLMQNGTVFTLAVTFCVTMHKHRTRAVECTNWSAQNALVRGQGGRELPRRRGTLHAPSQCMEAGGALAHQRAPGWCLAPHFVATPAQVLDQDSCMNRVHNLSTSTARYSHIFGEGERSPVEETVTGHQLVLHSPARTWQARTQKHLVTQRT